MKRFEHEVLTFTVDKPKDFAKMQETLREWGYAGFEIISVVPSDIHSKSMTVFFKREVGPTGSRESEAA